MTTPRRRRFGLRHADEWVGLLVLLAMAAFLAAVLQAGVLRDWLRPTSTLRILLPEQGVSGLSVGADMEVLGTKAGTVRRILFEQDRRMVAEVDVEEQARSFIRRDSAAVIRRRYGVAGAAYLDVSRGTGPGLDWSFAVIEATSERAPTETVGAVLDELKAKVFPVLDDLHRSARSIATMLERMERGEGSIGRLLTDDAVARSVQDAAADSAAVVQGVARLVERVDGVVQEAERLVTQTGTTTGVIPSLLRRLDQAVASLQQVTRDIARTTPRLPQTVRNVEEGTANLPALLTQTQQTARELEMLMTQLRGLWLLGGGGTPPPGPGRPPAERLRP
jgi:phospholipid/cholesterol/gamma-HCH transport system substrate-binding protein